MPSRQKEYWSKLYCLYRRSVRSQLKAAITRFKENVLASASNSSESDESKASKDLRLNKKQVLTELRSDEALEKDAGKLQDKTYG